MKNSLLSEVFMVGKVRNNSSFIPFSTSIKQPKEPTMPANATNHLGGHSVNLHSKVQEKSIGKTVHVKQQVLDAPVKQSQPDPHKAKLADRIKAPIMYLLNGLFKLGVFDYKLNQKSAHLIGDDILKKEPLSDLQGGLYFQTAKMLVDDMEKFVDPDAEGEVLEIAKQYLQSCKENFPVLVGNLVRNPFLNKVVGLILGTNSITNQLVAKFQRQIKGLEEGKSLLYPVNLKTPGGFHTITAAVMRAPPDEKGEPRFNLVIGNVGLGLENHQYARVNKEGKQDNYVYPYILEGMTLDQITNEEFLRGFIAQSSCAVDNDNKASQFYGFLNNYAQDKGIHVFNRDTGNIDSAKINEKGRHYQKSGTCILKSPSTALKFILPTDAYKKLMFKYKLHNWIELNEAKKGKSKGDQTIELLHNHAFEKLQKRIKKQAKIEQTTPDKIFKKYFSPEQQTAYSAYSNYLAIVEREKLEEFEQLGYQLF